MQRSAAVAAALRADGVGDRDVVLIHLANAIEFVVAYYGSLRAGATVTLVNPLQPVPGLRNQIVETGAVAAFTQTAQRDKLRAAAVDTTLRTVVVVDDAGALDAFVAGYTAAPPVAVTGDDVAHLAYTGGTTGVSKGVRVLHRNVIANVTQMIGWRAGTPSWQTGIWSGWTRDGGSATRGAAGVAAAPSCGESGARI